MTHGPAEPEAPYHGPKFGVLAKRVHGWSWQAVSPIHVPVSSLLISISVPYWDGYGRSLCALVGPRSPS